MLCVILRHHAWQCLEERAAEVGAALKQYVWHPYYIDALAVSYDSSGDKHYYTHDANFNVTAAIDESGDVVERYTYTPYGEVRYHEPDFDLAGTQASTIGNEYLFTGRRLDPESGLYHFRNRYYHPGMGRFVNRDPIGYWGGQMSLYEYLYSSPLNYIDPFGLGWRGGIWGGIYGAITGAAGGIISGAVGGAIGGAVGGFIVGGPAGALAGAASGAVAGAVAGGIAGAVSGGIQGAIAGSQVEDQGGDGLDAITEASKVGFEAGVVSGFAAGLMEGLNQGLNVEVPEGAEGSNGIGEVDGNGSGDPCPDKHDPVLNQLQQENQIQQAQNLKPPRQFNYGSHKNQSKWGNQMAQRGWTEDRIDEAIQTGPRFGAPNMINPGNPATRYVHPITGQSVVVDDVTGELIHVGGPGFQY